MSSTQFVVTDSVNGSEQAPRGALVGWSQQREQDGGFNLKTGHGGNNNEGVMPRSQQKDSPGLEAGGDLGNLTEYNQMSFDGVRNRQVGLVFLAEGTVRCAFTGKPIEDPQSW